MALLDKNQIMEIIPHRDPFLLIDEVEELEIGKRVVAKNSSRRIRSGSGDTFPNIRLRRGC